MSLECVALPAAGSNSPPGLAGGTLDRIDGEAFSFAQSLIGARQNVSPKRLVEPGPTAEQLHALLSLAAAAPDHGMLVPWRFILVPSGQRHHLAEVFARVLIDRNPGATMEQIESARDKAHRGPVLLVAVASLGPRQPNTPPLERMVSMGAAIQNILLGAHAMGFGAGLTSGQAMASKPLGDLCALADGEVAVCFVNIGTVSKRKGTARMRPLPAAFFSEMAGETPSAGVQ